MSSLAGEFLADLGDDEELAAVKQEPEDEELAEPMEDDDENMEDEGEDEKDKELEEKLKATLKNEDITKVATLLYTARFKNLIKVSNLFHTLLSHSHIYLCLCQ